MFPRAAGKNRDVPGCTQLSVQINAGQYASEMAWGIVEAYPEIRVPVGTYTAPFVLHPGPRQLVLACTVSS